MPDHAAAHPPHPPPAPPSSSPPPATIPAHSESPSPHREFQTSIFRPSPWFILLHRAETIVLCLAAWQLLFFLAPLIENNLVDLLAPTPLDAFGIAIFLSRTERVLAAALLLTALCALLFSLAEWLAVGYSVDADSVSARGGVLRRWSVRVRIADVRRVVATRSLRERLTGLGTIGLSTAAAPNDSVGASDVLLRYLPNHANLESALCARMSPCAQKQDAAAPTGAQPRAENTHDSAVTPPSERSGAHFRAPLFEPVAAPVRTPSSIHVPVIGLLGGIASGKSTVARIFESLGALVLDADSMVRDLLGEPETREILVGWWGRGVLDGEEKINRKEVARVVFSSPGERERLEKLLHPRVAARIREAIHSARKNPSPPRAVVIDAPLLLEAGLGPDCTALVFVDAPVEERIRRARDSRGWAAGELEKRESAQIGLDEKRSRADYVVRNAGFRPGDTRSALPTEAETVFWSIVRSGESSSAG